MEESHTEHHIQPSRCFCQIPDKEFKKWLIKRYRDGIQTAELMASTDDPHERELIGIVALFDVDDEKMMQMMGNVNLPEHHILHCRDNIRAMIEKIRKE